MEIMISDPREDASITKAAGILPFNSTTASISPVTRRRAEVAISKYPAPGKIGLPFTWWSQVYEMWGESIGHEREMDFFLMLLLWRSLNTDEVSHRCCLLSGNPRTSPTDFGTRVIDT